METIYIETTVVSYLLTWNYRHLANAQVLRQLENYLSGHGCICPGLHAGRTYGNMKP